MTPSKRFVNTRSLRGGAAWLSSESGNRLTCPAFASSRGSGGPGDETQMPKAKAAAVLTSALALWAGGAAAQGIELGFYGGLQSAPHSGVTISGDDALSDSDFTAGWDGRSLEAPVYYGLRATLWQGQNLGFGLDFTHSKVYADNATLAETGYDRLELSDGLNIVTLNAYYRWPGAMGSVTPYVGGGLGIAYPHVELTATTPAGTSETFGYQMTGPAVAVIAGVSVPISEDWSVFGEYKGTYSMNEAELDSGGTLETDIVTNAVNLGVSFSF